MPTTVPYTHDDTAEYEPAARAARRLGLSPDALRARCRRAARNRPTRGTVVELGGGIVALKFGSRWRVRFPSS